MDLPALRKKTAADVHLSHVMDLEARVHVLVVIKARFRVAVDGRVEPSDGAKVSTTDKLRDAERPESSSLEHASDLCLHKPFADIVCEGSAMARGREPRRELDVLIGVGAVQHTFRVFGARVWYKGLTDLRPTPPEPFTSVPLEWERAFGGRDASVAPVVEEPRNPVGRGISKNPASLLHKPLPDFEDPRALVQNERSRPTPMGAGPVMHHWAPRKAYAGTHDELWLRERVPLQPLDFDARHNQFAPPELIHPGYLRGGERVDLLHLCEHAAALRFELPKLSFYVGADTDGSRTLTEYRPVCDTLILKPNDMLFDMVFRTSIPWSRTRPMSVVQVHERRVLG